MSTSTMRRKKILKTLVPMATEILKDLSLHVYLAKSGVKDEHAGKLIAGHDLWRKSIVISVTCSKEDITRRISLINIISMTEHGATRSLWTKGFCCMRH